MTILMRFCFLANIRLRQKDACKNVLNPRAMRSLPSMSMRKTLQSIVYLESRCHEAEQCHELRINSLTFSGFKGAIGQLI